MLKMHERITQDAERLIAPYFRIVVSTRQHNEQFWLARAAIERCDSGEEVGGVQASGDSELSAREHMARELMMRATSFVGAPREWQNLRVRGLLIDYKKFAEESTRQLVGLKRELERGELTAESLQTQFRRFESRCVAAAIDFSRRLNTLTKDELVALMRSAEEVYRNAADPYNIDDMYVRDQLFEYVLEPDPDVVQAHALHVSELRRI